MKDHGRLVWERDGLDWPLRAHSRFVEVAGLRWHVQQLGPFDPPSLPSDAPRVLLLHGTGASTHSWRDVAPRLARSMNVLMLDLPGHAFTSAGPKASLSLTGMAQAIARLLSELGFMPDVVVGHSAGAAIALRMILNGQIAPTVAVSFNGALLPLSGWAGRLFLPAARVLAAQPVIPRLFAWQARERRVLEGLIGGTGSKLDERGLDLYGRLVRSPCHAAGALAMMAHWDLASLERDLPALSTALRLVVAEGDRTVPPSVSQKVCSLVPSAGLSRWPALGHLAHEEAPGQAADLIEWALNTRELRRLST